MCLVDRIADDHEQGVAMSVLAAFAFGSEETAIFLIAAVVAFALAAFSAPAAGRFPGGSLGLIAVGLLLATFPSMWQNIDAAF